MIYPVVCSCGFPIGAYADAYCVKRDKLLKESNAAYEANARYAALIQHSRESIDPKKDGHMGVFLTEELGIVHECCRTKLITTVTYDSVY